MNDSSIKLNQNQENLAVNGDASEQVSAPSAAISETRIAESATQTENISLPADKLNDLFLEAENTARQKAITELERLKIENQKLQIENHGLELQNQRLKDENLRLTELHDTRKQYVGRLFWLITSWLMIVITMVFLTAVSRGVFSLDSSVLIAFITSTTVSVIALFVIVAKWLFPSPLGDEKKEK